ncbi:MAG: Dabb family protein [Gemmataceae bacterium]
MAKVNHMVLIQFKDGTSEQTIAKCFQALAGLQQIIPGIEHFSGGHYSSPEGLNKGFTHAFVMTFHTPEARNTYLPHPEHEKVKEFVLPYVEDVIAFDYERSD